MSAFDWKSAFTSSLLVSRATCTTRSTIEPVGTGARIDMPSTFPLRSGSTTPIARAAPVDVGIRLIAAARARRRSLCGRSRMCWSFVYAWIVVMKPRSIVYASCSSFATRRDAVRRARRVRDDVVLLRVVLAVVDAEHDGEVRVGRGRGDDDLLRAGVEMLLRGLAVGEEPGRLDRDVDAELAPRQLRGIPLRDELDLVAADADEAVAGLDRRVERPEHRVVLEQVRHRLRVAEVVRGHDLEVAAPLRAARGGSSARSGRSR